MITFVTGNEKKWLEVRQILVPEEQGSSIEEIAIKKAKHAAHLLRRPVIIEDTALGFDNLRGLPGPYIKWFLERLGLAGLSQLGRASIPATAEGSNGSNLENGASAICTFVYCAGPEAEPIVFQGITRGRIVEPRGPQNFGWDPIFEPEEQQPSTSTIPPLTYAQMAGPQKNSISHRSKALRALKDHFLKEI